MADITLQFKLTATVPKDRKVNKDTALRTLTGSRCGHDAKNLKNSNAAAKAKIKIAVVKVPEQGGTYRVNAEPRAAAGPMVQCESSITVRAATVNCHLGRLVNAEKQAKTHGRVARQETP